MFFNLLLYNNGAVTRNIFACTLLELILSIDVVLVPNKYEIFVDAL